MSEIENIDQLLRKNLTSEFLKEYIDLKGYCIPAEFAAIAEKIDKLEVRDEDIWVCSYAKTGTTWAMEMVWCIDNDLNFAGAKVPLPTRFPFLEATMLSPCRKFIISGGASNWESVKLKEEIEDSVGYVNRMPNPRYIKTHLPFELLPRQIRTGERKPKIIYVTRNPKDTCISFYYYMRRVGFKKIIFEEFCALFYVGKVLFGSFWKHVLSYWNQRIWENLLILQFEEMKADLPAVIRRTASFLGKKVEEDDMKKLTEHLSFASMKTNPAVNKEHLDTEIKFMRSGEVGQWKECMSKEFIEKFDKITKEKFKDTDFYY